MSDLKTQPTQDDVMAFLQGVDHQRRKEDALTLLDIMTDITGEPPVMWGTSIVGFGSYHYKYASGREGDWFITGFSPRKQSMTVYIMDGFNEYDGLMETLGKHKTGTSCLYINKLDDVDIDVLKSLIQLSYTYMREAYPPAENKDT